MKIHFFGNCQTGALRRMLDEDHPGWKVTNHELGTEGDTDPARVAAHVRATEAADVIVVQPVAAWKGVTDLSLKAVEAMKRSGADLVTIPSIVLKGEGRLSRGDYLARSIDFYGRALQADLLYMPRGSREEEFLAAFGSRGPYPEPQAKGLPPTVREHARAWLRVMYPAFLGRSASGGEIETHLGGIEAVGLGEWLTAFAESAEIRDRQARLAPGGGPGG